MVPVEVFLFFWHVDMGLQLCGGVYIEAVENTAFECLCVEEDLCLWLKAST